MSTATTTPGFPFSAVVGHDDLRLALLLNAVHPGVGGVLVRGEKGTAKSTAVRALAALLPAVAVVEGCRFACDPADPDPRCPDGPHPPASAGGDRPARLVELPVGASEDRLVGSLDLEKALSQGVRAYQPGLLADATAVSSTSTRSTCCTTTSSTSCSTPPRWGGRTWSATGCRWRTRRGSCWSAR